MMHQSPLGASRDVHSDSLQQRSRRSRTRRSLFWLTILVIIAAQFILYPFLLYIKLVDPSLSAQLLQHPFSISSYTSSSIKSLPDKRPSQQQQPHRILPNRPPDATLNGVPLYLQHSADSWPVSHVHCVGENYLYETAWKQRSCRFTNLCFNVTSQEFLIFESAEEQVMAQYLEQRPFLYSSSTIRRYGPRTSQAVAIGGINLKWGEEGTQRLKWFPRVVPQKDAGTTSNFSYYTMPDFMIWIPFHSMNGANPGHFVWDDMFPIYNLLHMFQLLPPEPDGDGSIYNTLFPMRYVLTNGERGLWASCDVRPEKKAQCRKIMNKFIPLLLGKDYPYQFTTTQDFMFMRNNYHDTTEVVCARTGLAGIASLTDHGISKMHGWEKEDYLITHNHGRGGILYDYRNFMMRNMGYVQNELLWHRRLYENQKRLHRIVFSENSSDIPNRNMDLNQQIQVVQSHFSSDYINVEAYILKELSLRQQLEIVHDASVFVTLCGGGAVTAMFLPAGASVFMIYSEDGGVKANRLTGKPAYLDWDLFNAMSHLRVHWLPRNSMKKKLDQEYFVALLKHELSLMDQQVFL